MAKAPERAGGDQREREPQKDHQARGVPKQLVNKAASGDAKAIQLLLGEIRQLEGREPPSTESVLFDEADRELISQLYDRFRGSRPEDRGASDDAKPSTDSGSEP